MKNQVSWQQTHKGQLKTFGNQKNNLYSTKEYATSSVHLKYFSKNLKKNPKKPSFFWFGLVWFGFFV